MCGWPPFLPAPPATITSRQSGAGRRTPGRAGGRKSPNQFGGGGGRQASERKGRRGFGAEAGGTSTWALSGAALLPIRSRGNNSGAPVAKLPLTPCFHWESAPPPPTHLYPLHVGPGRVIYAFQLWARDRIIIFFNEGLFFSRVNYILLHTGIRLENKFAVERFIDILFRDILENSQPPLRK